jgi:hypothetical protein
MKYVYVCLVLLIAAGWFTALYFCASKRRPRSNGLRVRDILFVWPLIIDSRRDENGDFKLKTTEIVGILVMIALMTAGFFLTPHRAR